MSAGKDGDEKSREEHIDEIVRACGARRHPGDMDWMKEPKRSSRAKAKAKQKKEEEKEPPEVFDIDDQLCHIRFQLSMLDRISKQLK